MRPTDDELRALLELESRSTKGPWREATDAQGTCGFLHPKKKGQAVAWFSSCHVPLSYVGDDKRKVGIPDRQANADFILAAKVNIRAIVEELLERRNQEQQRQSAAKQRQEDRCLCGGRGCNSCEPRGFYGYR